MIKCKHCGIYRPLAVCLAIVFLVTFFGCSVTTSATTQSPEAATTTTVTTTTTITASGTVFTVSNLLIQPAQVKIRENFGISVLVTNSGNVPGTLTVSLKVNGQVVAEQQITLDAGASDTVMFKHSQETPGTYTVDVNGCQGEFVVVPPPTGAATTTTVQQTTVYTTPATTDWTIPTGTGANFRAVHMGGNWGTNRTSVANLPDEYFRYLRDLNVNWVGISVALHIDGSMDSTVELDYSESLQIPTFRDDTLRSLIQAFRNHGFDVYIHMAFESGAAGEHPVSRWQLGDPLMHLESSNIQAEYWPWRTDHPQHASFVASFWQSYTDCLVHIARIAEEEGVGMMTLGTETDRLFRSRSGGRWTNNFLNEIQAMVSAVRAVYNGQLGYEMHYQVLVDRNFFGPGSDYLVSDLDLDFIAVSAYFPLVQNIPNSVPTVLDLEGVWDAIFNGMLKPLKERNGNKPLIFTEFGYVDSLVALQNASADEFTNKVFKDNDGNGKDDGEEAQANAYEALFNTMDKYPGVVKGAFLWDVNMATEQAYQQSFAKNRTFNIRGKLAEAVVRERYADWL
ncbi:MAG: hypothetical protein JW856_00050 [Dehalococcoidales bacterium]|nr:hypothetical protein [Dehalococcoidales bacterium]